ncbi:DNA phosphorothioation-associated putative methyltransferase [Rhizobium leguminosarum]|uniref:DNA phosphorothioation-associated putative methyltransferase n=1 Tax=Rhizobium leguminosarum TaxID=384 RepID=UPI000401AAAD|nr:DNA phosphorothioation-associated putative methyltransferase [Rhizobium leguminosarum]
MDSKPADNVSKDKTVAPGKRVGGSLYLHRSAQDRLSGKDGELLLRALALAPDVDWNVSKTANGKVSLLLYEDFSLHAFPALLSAATIGLSTGATKRTDYSKRANPPILHRKELLLPPDDARIPAFAAITRLAEEKGLFTDTKTIGTREAWNRLVEAAGLRIDGPRLLHADSGRIEVSREKTAITRVGLSSPVAAMIECGMLTKDDDLFDYGCGMGDDVAILQADGYSAWGWDPAHRPDGRRAPADVVNLGFVVNVIENPHERAETLRAAWSFARKGMTVSAMLTGRVDVSRQTPHGDGYLTMRSTFQRYYAQDELMLFVNQTLGERVTPLGQGIVAVFRDKELEQRVAMRKRSRADAIIRRHALPRPVRAPREALPPRPSLVERISGETASIWETALSLGRLPTADEVDLAVMVSLSDKNVSLARAMQACFSLFDMPLLDEVAAARREDLLVETALSMFPGAPRYASLPVSMQRDVRHFFGSHAALSAQATNELSALRNSSSLQAAYDKSVDEGLASLNGGILRFAGASSTRLPVAIRIMLGCADIVRPGFSQGDVFEIGPKPAALKAITVADMETPLPRMLEIVDVELGRASSRERKARDEILYLKSLYLPIEDPKRTAQAALDDRLLASNVVTKEGKGPAGRVLTEILTKSRSKS